MADITHLYSWVPKDSGITIEEPDDHILEVKRDGIVIATYYQGSVTEDILKEHVKNLEGVLKG